jgi:taurine dioxygenase
MQYRKLGEVLGAEVLDFDAARPATSEQQQQLRDLFAEFHLLLIRGQDLHEADHDRITGYFGPLSLMRAGDPAGHISNKPDLDGLVVTGQKELVWHADGTYGIHPGIGTSLLAIEVVPETAPTMFANAVRALEDLPADLRATIEGLTSVHYRDTYIELTDTRVREEDIRDAEPGRFRSYRHPLVYPLPHTDKQVLWLNERATSHIVELPRDEGEELIQQLFAHIYAPENTYTHHWQNGDFVIWDNIALQHRRPEFGAAIRHLRRLSLDGWNLGDGTVLDWPAAGTARDTEDLAA